MKPTKVFFETIRAWKDGVRTLCHKGSARSGKTVGITHAGDFLLSEFPVHRKWSIVSQSLPHLKSGVVYEYEQYIKKDQLIREHNKGDKTFIINKSVIDYFSLDVDGMKAIGPGRDFLWLNEPNKGISFESYTDLDIRTKEMVIMDWNPSGDFWLQEQDVLNGPNVRVIHSTWLDNIVNLSRQQIETFIYRKKLSKQSAYWDYWWKVYGLGEDSVLLEERIMPMLKRASRVPDDAVEIPYGLDFGFFPDPTVFIRMWVKKRELIDDLYIQEVAYGTRYSINSRGDNTANLVDYLQAKDINRRHLGLADSADPKSIEELRGAGYAIEAVKKTSVETSIRLFHDYNIHILDGSENVYKEMNSYKYKRNRKGVLLPIPEEGQADHAIDAIRYVLLSRNTRWSIKNNIKPTTL